METADYGLAVLRTLNPALGKAEIINMAALGLTGEAGEFADSIKKILYHGHSFDEAVPNLILELGDIQWYIAVAAFALDVSLGTVLQKNLDKLEARYPSGFDSERSFNRPK